MTRLARVVVPGYPHHVTQRGNGRARNFFGDDDCALYRDLLAGHCRAANVAVWAWCLMPNHVHLVLVPSDTTSAPGVGGRASPLCRHHSCAGPAHRPFLAGAVGAAVMDEAHLPAAARRQCAFCPEHQRRHISRYADSTACA